MKLLLVITLLFSLSFANAEEFVKFDDFKERERYDFLGKDDEAIGKDSPKYDKSLEKLKIRKMRLFKDYRTQHCIKKAKTKIEVGKCIDDRKLNQSKKIIQLYKKRGKDPIY